MSLISGSQSLGTADIVGIAIGGVLAIATVIGLIFSCYAMCCRKKNPQQVVPQQNQNNPYQQPNGPHGQQSNTGYHQQNPPYQQYPPYQQNPPYQQYPPYQQQQAPSAWNKPPNMADRPPSYSTTNPGVNPYGKH